MTSRPSYQLTEHPVGSLREIWSVSWPLMLGLCSASMMMFSDRLYLSHYSVASMNAMAIGGLTCFLILVLPFSIAQITEVFVGKYHGEEKHTIAARPVWQILWISLASWPLLAYLARLVGDMVYDKTALETIYLVQMMDFTPCFLASVGLMGFFIGIGKTRLITLATVSANLVNIVLAPLFIFGSSFLGSSFLPSMGIKGAGIATGLAQLFQALFLLLLFVKEEYRTKFNTHKVCFDYGLIREMLALGVPSGLGRLVEVLAHLVFFRILALAGEVELSLATMVQSFYLLVIFCIDGMSKGATTIISNLVGAKVFHLIPRAISSAVKVQLLLFCAIFCISLGFCEWIFSATLQESERLLLYNPSFVWSLRLALICMSLFYLLDGISWILSGHLMAVGDSKYIMYISSSIHWFTYVLPVYYFVTQCAAGAVTGWMMLVFDGMVVCLLFWLRSSQHIKQVLGSPGKKIAFLPEGTG